MTPWLASARNAHSPIRGAVGDGVAKAGANVEEGTGTCVAGRVAGGTDVLVGGGIGVGVAVTTGDGLGRAGIRVAVAEGDGRGGAVGVVGVFRGEGENVRVVSGSRAITLGVAVAVAVGVGWGEVGTGPAGSGEGTPGCGFAGDVAVAAARETSAVGVARRATTTFGPQETEESRSTTAQRARDRSEERRVGKE